ncbi:MAG: AraC family transcriptional regulator [Firmicutes bacterium]|nr:AraC family transcriptional regulator [Bacillota bacterium]
MDLKARVSYLQGLAAGLELPGESKESRLLNGIIEVLHDFASEWEAASRAREELEDYLESLDEDLGRLEEVVYDGEVPDDDRFIEVRCPNCGEMVCFESDLLADGEPLEVTCPECEAVVYSTGTEGGNGEAARTGGDEDL